MSDDDLIPLEGDELTAEEDPAWPAPADDPAEEPAEPWAPRPGPEPEP